MRVTTRTPTVGSCVWMRSILWGLCAFAFSILSACSDSPTLVVSVATGLVPGPEFTVVLTDVVSASDTEVGHAFAEARFGDSFSRGRQVASFDVAEAGEFVVRVRLLRANGTFLIERRVRVNVTGDYALVVHLTRDCLGVECPAPGGSAALTECLHGQCVDPRCAPPSREFCPEVLFCNDASECSATAACADAVCTTGICEEEITIDACATGAYCNPDVGCLPFVEEMGDGGMPMTDAGMLDADVGVDGSVVDASDGGIVCNTVCTPEADPCYVGYWECSGESPVCARLVPKRSGTDCGDGLVCDAVGACVACVNGSTCVEDCMEGTLDCSSGQGVCDVGSTSADAGTACTTESYCGGGVACTPDYVCSTDGVCTSCVNGAACTVGCSTGTLNCASGAVCELDGGDAAAGTRCEAVGEAEAHCTASGTCTLCTEGVVCAPDSECQWSTLSCATGSPTCTPRYYQDIGVPCAGGTCNGGGVCASSIGLQASSISAGARHTCVASSGQAICFGDNSDGQLGTGDTSSVDGGQVVVDGLPVGSVAVVAAGGDFSIALNTMLSSYIPHTWGANASGQLCTGDVVAAFTPQITGLGGKFERLDAGLDFGCLLEAPNGDVYCWGNGSHTGTGAVGPQSAIAAVPLPSTGAMALATGDRHACAILDRASFGHRVKCWGDNDFGQLGAGTVTANESAPVDAFGIDDARLIAAGGEHTCALRGSGVSTYVSCWGRGTEGQLGNISPVSSAYPGYVLLPEGLRVDLITSIAVGGQHSCLIVGGRVLCWGRGTEGQLGDGASADIGAPRGVAGISGAVALSLGDRHSCALLSSAEVACWGDNSYGQLGDGTLFSHPTPELLPRLTP